MNKHMVTLEEVAKIEHLSVNELVIELLSKDIFTINKRTYQLVRREEYLIDGCITKFSILNMENMNTDYIYLFCPEFISEMIKG